MQASWSRGLKLAVVVVGALSLILPDHHTLSRPPSVTTLPDDAFMQHKLAALAGYERVTLEWANRTCPACLTPASCPLTWQVATNARDGYSLHTYGAGEIISAACLSAGSTGRFFEEAMSDFINALLKTHAEGAQGGAAWASWLLDVGSNIGVHTMHAAAAGAHVIAVEANPATAVRIRCSVARNGFGGRVHVINAAVQDTGGPPTRCINSPRDYNEGMAFVSSDCAVGAASVPTHTLDGLFDRLPMNLPAPAVFKLDVEGFEVFVLRGARQWLARKRPSAIVFEVNSGWLARAGDFVWTEAAALLTDLGYSVWIPSPLHADMLGPPLTIKELTEIELSANPHDASTWTHMDHLNVRLAACEFNLVASTNASGFSVPVPRDFCTNRRRRRS